MLTPKSYSARANRTTDLRTVVYVMRCWLGRRQVGSGRAEGERGIRRGCQGRIRGNTSGEEGLKLGVKGWVGRALNYGLRSEIRERAGGRGTMDIHNQINEQSKRFLGVELLSSHSTKHKSIAFCSCPSRVGANTVADGKCSSVRRT